MEFKTFQALKQARSEGYTSMVKAGIEGFLDQHTGFYPDPAHFLYELLQNAEDMDATQVTFCLERNRLVFEHNGTKRDFELRDIDSITNKSKSQKADDPTQIGKFGMGFKAVYDYTNTPEIHSGPYHFRIEHYIVPSDDNVPAPSWIQGKKKDHHTQFIFPFNNARKPAAKAVTEIMEGLKNFNETSLLFLQHIQVINYTLPDMSQGSVSIRNHVNGSEFITAISVRDPKGASHDTYWARFSEECPLLVRDEDSSAQALKKFPVSIAYRLNRIIDMSSKERKARYTVDPTLAGKVCIFFPTEIESSLRFHINAPFASTVARDVILYTGEDGDNNYKMLSTLAELACKSLHMFKQRGMLGYDAYNALPLLKDYELKPESRYRLFATRIRDEFTKCDLFITEQGKYAFAKDVLYSTVGMKKVLPSPYVEEYFGKSWIPTFRPATRTESFFQQFSIEEYSIEKFIDELEANPAYFDRLFQSLCSKDYIHNLYAVLSQADTRLPLAQYGVLQRYDGRLTRNQIMARVRFLLCEDGKLHSAQEHVYFRTSYVPVMFQLHPLYLDITLRDNQQDRAIKDFLYAIGVKDMCAAEDLTTGETEDVLSDANSDDIVISAMILVDNYRNGKIDIEEYRNLQKFVAVNINDPDIEMHAVCAADCCWSEEAAFFNRETKYLLAMDLYKRELGEDYLTLLYDIFGRLGGKTGPEITETRHLSEETFPLYNRLSKAVRNCATLIMSTWTIKDYDWSTFENIAGNRMYSTALMLWKMVLATDDDKCLITMYQPNRRAKMQTLESTLVYYLKRVPWVPTVSGDYKCPYDLEEGDLPDDFRYDNSTPLLNEISKAPHDLTEELKSKGVQDENVLAFAGFDADIQERAIKAAMQMQAEKARKGKTLTEASKAASRPQTGTYGDDEDDLYGEGENSADNCPGSGDGYSTGPGNGNASAAEGYARRTGNLSRRKMKLEEEFDDRGSVTVPTRAVRFVLQNTMPEEKEFVRHQYGGRCQICGTPGILTAKGKRYFEAINIFSTGNLDDSVLQHMDLGWNTLSLCPMCAARFKYSQLDISTLITQVLSLNAEKLDGSALAVDITLENKPERISFTPQHLLALQVAIRKLQQQENEQANKQENEQESLFTSSGTDGTDTDDDDYEPF